MKNEEKNNDSINKELNNEIPDNDENNVEEMEKINELENQVQELKDQLLRKAAEFENYKRRTENDQMNLLSYAAESFILKLLPIVDDFERSLKHINETKDAQVVKDGIKLMYEKFYKTLNDQGVKKIEAVGKPFDVDYHDALMQRIDESVPPHTVLEEIESGYMYKDKVIRHSKVIVSEETTENVNDNSDEENEINIEGEE